MGLKTGEAFIISVSRNDYGWFSYGTKILSLTEHSPPYKHSFLLCAAFYPYISFMENMEKGQYYATMKSKITFKGVFLPEILNL